MVDTGKNLLARSGVTRILHLDRHCHDSRIVQSGQQVFHSCWKAGECGNERSRGGNIFRGTAFAAGAVTTKTLGKGKGCDIGYALAINSCEGANSVEARTVTALDAITAFAVPNPNRPSQSRRFFQVWLLIGLPF